ncbi:MAG TPA: TolC family protein [Candidatus Eremiobacteraceae bacterium]|nr:TolC family protein [Candidatus Eremiobacteraceae bacterium]
MTPRFAAAAAAFLVLTAARAALAAPTPSPSPSSMSAPAMSSTQPSTQIPMSINLSQAETIALASSPVLALARGQLESSLGSVGTARAGELPNISGSASTGRAKSISPPGNFGGFVTQSTTTLTTTKSAALTLRQLLIDGGRIHEAVSAAKFSSDAARYDLERQMQSVEFNVASSYYAALQARHQLQVARDSLNLAQVQLKLVQAQFKAGVASKADVLTAQLPVAQAELAVAQAANGEQTQLALMLDTMGLPAQTPVTISDEPASPVPLSALADVLAIANRDRPDLLAAQSSANGAAASLRSARLGLFPSISGSGSTNTNSSKQTTDQPNTSGSGPPTISSTTSGVYAPSWSIGLQLSVPIFDGGLTRGETAQAQGALDQANANLKTTQLLVSLNVQQAYLGVETAQAGLTAADAEYSQARTVLDVTNAQYKAGVTTLPLLLNAQVALAKAEGDQVNALYTYKTAWQQLLISEGTLGQ